MQNLKYIFFEEAALNKMEQCPLCCEFQPSNQASGNSPKENPSTEKYCNSDNAINLGAGDRRRIYPIEVIHEFLVFYKKWKQSVC